MKNDEYYSFLLAVDKPTGITSHDVVNDLRRKFSVKRIGHMGTLDPLATGVLIVGIGQAARLNKFIESARKAYVVRAKFGSSTTTYDANGTLVRECEVPKKIGDIEFAKKSVSTLCGTHLQTPPEFSAIKVNGKRAYQLARSGKNINLVPRKIHIYSVEILQCKRNFWDIYLEVSKGTYIRSIVNDLECVLNCPAHVSQLRRVRVGNVSLNFCKELDNINNANYIHLNPLTLLDSNKVMCTFSQFKKIQNGNTLSLKNSKYVLNHYNSKENLNQYFAMIYENKLCAIYKQQDDYENICPDCVFTQNGGIEI